MTLGNRDRDPRIRHLPPVDGSGKEPAGNRFPSVPRAAALLGVAAAFTLILVVFGLGGRLPEETTDTTIPDLASDEPVDFTTTTVTLPETLGDRLGNEVESLRLAVVDADGSSVLLWHSSALEATPHPVSGSVIEPRFDASGKFIAFLDGGAIYVQQAGRSGLDGPLVAGGRGFAWHPTDEARFALAVAGTAGTDILDGRATSAGLEVGTTASVPGRAHLVSWGDWGYALAFDESSTLGGGVPGILILDEAGAPVRAVAGQLKAAAGASILIEGPGEDTAPVWTEVLRTAAPAPSVVETPFGLDLVDENLESRHVFAGEASDDLELLMDDSGDRLALWEAGSTLTVNVVDFTINVPRVIAFQEPVRPISFVRGGQALALQSVTSNDLLIVDARTGATVRIDLDPETTVLDASL